MSKRKSDVKEQAPEVIVPTSGGSVKSEGTKVVGQTKNEGTKVEEVKHTCAECRFYDVSTEREFHRDGMRKGLVETRSICRAPKDVSNASHHLVKRESVRPCIQLGTYVEPAKETKGKRTEEQPAEKKTTEPQTQQTSNVQTETQTPIKTKTKKPREHSWTNSCRVYEYVKWRHKSSRKQRT